MPTLVDQPCPACNAPLAEGGDGSTAACTRCGLRLAGDQTATAIVSENPHFSQPGSSWRAEPGAQLDAYVLERRLGGGAMAEVWLARQPDLQREVAIKILLPGYAADTAVQKRFQREVLALSRLQHPNILPITERGAIGGRAYFVSPLVAQSSLRELLDAHPGGLPFARVEALARDMLQALIHAHHEGMVHRDLKPDNLLLNEDGRCIVADFGIARIRHDRQGKTLSRLTQSQFAIGTVAYMSPEQSLGGTVDERSDLYSLAVVLYECLSGHLPQGRFEEPRQFLPDDDRERSQRWHQCLLACLERQAERRPADARAVLEALFPPQRAQATAPIHITPQPAATEPPTSPLPHLDPGNYPHGRRLYRPQYERWIRGVAAGMAAWSGLHVTWVRIAWIIAAIASFGSALLVYIVLSLVIPKCPNILYRPRPLNAWLPRRRRGWAFGVCACIAHGLHLPTWLVRVVAIATTPLSLIPYLLAAILLPPPLLNAPLSAPPRATVTPPTDVHRPPIGIAILAGLPLIGLSISEAETLNTPLLVLAAIACFVLFNRLLAARSGRGEHGFFVHLGLICLPALAVSDEPMALGIVGLVLLEWGLLLALIKQRHAVLVEPLAALFAIGVILGINSTSIPATTQALVTYALLMIGIILAEALANALRGSKGWYRPQLPNSLLAVAVMGCFALLGIAALS